MNANEALSDALSKIEIRKPPAALYRFNRENDLTSLTEGKLKLTPPKFFNDPFEMWAGISTETLSEEKMIRSVTAHEGLFKAVVRHKNPQAMHDMAAYDQMIVSAVRSTPENWPIHLSSMVDGVREIGSRQFGVTCLSGFSEEEMHGEIGIRHWAMYGDDHRGLCIEYDGTHNFFRSIAEAKWLFPVNYLPSRKLVDVSEFDDWSDKHVMRILREWLAMKSERAWGHEKEWRLVHPLRLEAGPWHFLVEGEGNKQRSYLRFWAPEQSLEDKSQGSRAIRRIWLGCRTREDLRSAVLSAINAPYLKHVEVWSLSPCLRDFKLLPKRLA